MQNVVGRVLRVIRNTAVGWRKNVVDVFLIAICKYKKYFYYICIGFQIKS